MAIQFKRTTNANSSSAVADGQPAVLKRDGKSPRLKIGDGTNTFTQLPFATPDAEIYKDNSFTLSQGSTYNISTPQLLGIFIDNSLMLTGGNITVTSDFGRLQILDDIEGSTSASIGTSSFPYGSMYSKTYNLGVIGNISASIGQYGVLKSTLYENNTSFTNYYDIIQSSQTGLSFGGIGLPTSYGKIVFNYNPGGSSSDGIAITSSASLYPPTP